MKTIQLKQPDCTLRQITSEDKMACWMLPKQETHFDRRIKRQTKGRIEYIGAFLSERAVAHVILDLEDHPKLHAHTNGEKCAYVVDLHVIQVARRLGIARGLLQYLEERCEEHGIGWLGLDVNPENNAVARQLYLDTGYEQIRELELTTYDLVDDDGNPFVYEDWCIGLLKRIKPG
jgi:GNAT superfamily N-acetyltransferase